MSYLMILEVFAWIATPFLIAAIFGLHEDAELAIYMLTKTEKRPSEEGARQHIKLIKRKWHYIWIMPLLACCILWLTYRQIYVHPSETLFGVKLLCVGVLLVAIVLSVWKLYMAVSLIYGKEKEETERGWKESADNYKRVVGKDIPAMVVDLEAVQKSLKSTFLFFVSCLFFTGFMIWNMFF